MQQAVYDAHGQKAPPALQRAVGRARMVVEASGPHQSQVVELFQQGSLKVRLPHLIDQREVQFVLINTSGGLTGGDRLSVDVSVRKGASATVTTPACERIYRSSGGDAVVQQKILVENSARLDWLPQETIVYDRLNRPGFAGGHWL